MALMFACKMYLKLLLLLLCGVIEFDCFVATGLRAPVLEWMVSVFA